ncbi:MAG: DUF1579 family protein [Planctomycetota bacterium]|nr:DUF1579 family protein [Planctomycetota bacterium]
MSFRPLVTLGLGALALAALPACSSTRSGADPKHSSGARPAAMSEEEAMAKMMAMAAPGPAHAELMSHAGTWLVDYQYRMGPDAPWQPMQGTVTSKPVLGGRYLMEEHAMEMMGMPMQGLLFLGYDNSTKEYTSLWMDTSSTWWVEARGGKSAEGTVSMSGTMKDIAGERPYRMKSWGRPDGSMESEMYDTIGGQEVLVMTMKSRRKP